MKKSKHKKHKQRMGALGMSEEAATRALEAVKRSLKRTAGEAKPKGKTVAGLVNSTASKAYLHHLVDNGMLSGAARANDYKVAPQGGQAWTRRRRSRISN